MRAILTYHSIDSSGSPISVSPEVFRGHCRFLASGRVRVLPLEVLVQDAAAGDAVALTFDDGFANFATEAASVLEDHGLPYTVFVVSDHVGGHNDWGGRPATNMPHLPLLDWDHLAALQNRGATIGAHTRRHRPLTQLRGEELADEVQGGIDRIEAALGRRPTTFAYPYGAVNAEAASAVREACAWGCTTELRALGGDEDRALLPRLDMYYLRAPGQLEAWGTAAFRSRLWLRSQGRRLRRLASGAGRAMEHAA
jgi:peptidoglycan/xylan/chitin deacetylase (PgdA/CDA1 family)